MNGILQISLHQARCSGLRVPMKRVRECSAASRWLRVVMRQWRACSRWCRNWRTPSGGHVADAQPIDRGFRRGGDEGDQQRKRVSVTPLGVRREVAFAHQVLEQKPTDPRSQEVRFTHGAPPVARSAQIADSRVRAAPGSSSGSVGSTRAVRGRDTSTGAVTSAGRPPLLGTTRADGGRQRCAVYAGSGINGIRLPSRRCCGGTGKGSILPLGFITSRPSSATSVPRPRPCT